MRGEGEGAGEGLSPRNEPRVLDWRRGLAAGREGSEGSSRLGRSRPGGARLGSSRPGRAGKLVDWPIASTSSRRVGS